MARAAAQQGERYAEAAARQGEAVEDAQFEAYATRRFDVAVAMGRDPRTVQTDEGGRGKRAVKMGAPTAVTWWPEEAAA